MYLSDICGSYAFSVSIRTKYNSYKTVVKWSATINISQSIPGYQIERKFYQSEKNRKQVINGFSNCYTEKPAHFIIRSTLLQNDFML